MYWGKIIGFLIGFITRNPWILLIGVFLGHQFDRGLTEKYRSFKKQNKNSFVLPENFVRTLFEIIGHLAKVDGRVTEDEIRSARMIMQRLNLSSSQINRAIYWFNEGKNPEYPFIENIRNLHLVTARDAKKRLIFVQLLLEVLIAKKDFKRAIGEFVKVFNYAGTDKDDDAQLKLGLSYQSMGSIEKAKNEFQRLIDYFPGSEYYPKAKDALRKLSLD